MPGAGGRCRQGRGRPSRQDASARCPEPTSSLTTITGPGLAWMAARPAATAPSRIGSMAGTSSPSSVLSHSVKPSMRAGSSGSVSASAAARSVPTSTVGHETRTLRPVARDPVVELGIAGPRRSEEPDSATLREAGRRGESEPTLPAARATEREDQRVGHAIHRPSPDTRRGSSPASLTSRAPRPSAPPRP